MLRASCFLILAWTALAGDAAFSDEISPKAPTPSAQSKKIAENPFRCDRLIKFRGKILPCDSPLRRDGESLRSIFEKSSIGVPDAIDELDRYQAGRNSMKLAAYTGTAGLFMLLAGGLITNTVLGDSKANCREGANRTLRYAGAGLTVGGILFGLSVLRTNEGHLQSAILKYNASQPDQPIEVMYKAEF